MAVRNIWNGRLGTLKFATTQGGLVAASDYGCQVSTAAINSVPKLQTVPATMCASETQIPGVSGWEFNFAVLQDWNVSGGGISKFMFDHDTELYWFSYVPDTPISSSCVGQAYLLALSYGGEFGGAPFVGSVTLPVPNKPTITVPA